MKNVYLFIGGFLTMLAIGLVWQSATPAPKPSANPAPMVAPTVAPMVAPKQDLRAWRASLINKYAALKIHKSEFRAFLGSAQCTPETLTARQQDLQQEQLALTSESMEFQRISREQGQPLTPAPKP